MKSSFVHGGILFPGRLDLVLRIMGHQENLFYCWAQSKWQSDYTFFCTNYDHGRIQTLGRRMLLGCPLQTEDWL